MLDHESQEERREDWISRLFRLSEGPLPNSPASSHGTPKTKKRGKAGKAKSNKTKKTKKVPSVLPA